MNPDLDNFDFDICISRFLMATFLVPFLWCLHFSTYSICKSVSTISDFNARNKTLTAKTFQQGNLYHKMRKVFFFFFFFFFLIWSVKVGTASSSLIHDRKNTGYHRTAMKQSKGFCSNLKLEQKETGIGPWWVRSQSATVGPRTFWNRFMKGPSVAFEIFTATPSL